MFWWCATFQSVAWCSGQIFPLGGEVQFIEWTGGIPQDIFGISLARSEIEKHDSRRGN